MILAPFLPRNTNVPTHVQGRLLQGCARRLLDRYCGMRRGLTSKSIIVVFHDCIPLNYDSLATLLIASNLVLHIPALATNAALQVFTLESCHVWETPFLE